MQTFVPAAESPRLRALAGELNRRDLTVVALQEVQAQRYRQLLINACSSYPAQAFEPFVHAPKGGLLTLAGHPCRSGKNGRGRIDRL